MAIATGTALLGAAAIGAGASMLGGSAQKKAAKNAANIEMQMARENNALSRENRDLMTGHINPYNQVGLGANNALAGQVAAGPYNGGSINSTFLQSMNPGSFTDYKASTGYDARMDAGTDAIQTNYAARGALRSGAAMKDLTRFAQDYGSDEYQKWRSNVGQYGTYADQFANQERGYKTDQYNNWINLLGNQQGVGVNALGILGGVNTNMTNQIINSNSQSAAAQGNAALASGQATAGMYAGIGNALGTAAGYYSQAQNPFAGNPYSSVPRNY